MGTSPPLSSQTILDEPPQEQNLSNPLDLSVFPPIFVLPTHIALDDLHKLEDELVEYGANLTYDVTEAKIFLGKVASKKRVEFDLRTRGLWTKEIMTTSHVSKRPLESNAREQPTKRMRRESLSPLPSSAGNSADVSGDAAESETESESDHLGRKQAGYGIPNKSGDAGTTVTVEDSTSDSEIESEARKRPEPVIAQNQSNPFTPAYTDSRLETPTAHSTNLIRVLKLAWFEDSLKSKSLLPLESYLVYEGLSIPRPTDAAPPEPSPKPASLTTHETAQKLSTLILERAKADGSTSTSVRGPSHYAPSPHGPRRLRNQHQTRTQHLDRSDHQEQLELLQQATSEHEGTDSELPPPPQWVRDRLKYACQRSTPAHPPNEDFMKELEKVKMARLLTGDEIGVRAYSTSIASIGAYPHKFRNPREILRLPGCDVKITNLWVEWKNTGHIQAAEEAEKDESLKVLRLFYGIWGVGEKTARDFYYDKGWKDLDDVIEYGWSGLSRVQQIGVKFYDEFLKPIPRREVEFIAEKIREHAVRVRDEGIELLVVGGYRRGKVESNDVDVIISHRDFKKTMNLAKDIVDSLDAEEWISHTLSLHETMTDRAQSTLPFKAVGVASHGTGFDTLDKALVVWQDPNWPTKSQDLERNPNGKNPNIHRRVDIIVSPWRTVGCAVCGWSGGTTFQRDLRRYAKYVKGWKFDSSGVRDRKTGQVVELEGPEGVSGSMVDAEKKVFEGLGLVYKEPWERWTG